MVQAETAPQERPKALLAGWISRPKLAKELGLTVDTLGRWQRQRIGPACIKAGRRVFYARELAKVELDDDQLTTGNFKPGSSGESAFYKVLSGKTPPGELFE